MGLWVLWVLKPKAEGSQLLRAWAAKEAGEVPLVFAFLHTVCVLSCFQKEKVRLSKYYRCGFSAGFAPLQVPNKVWEYKNWLRDWKSIIWLLCCIYRQKDWGKCCVHINIHTLFSLQEAASFLQAASHSLSHFLPWTLVTIPDGWWDWDRGQQLLVSVLPVIPNTEPCTGVWETDTKWVIEDNILFSSQVLSYSKNFQDCWSAETVLYDLGGSYVGIYICENSLSCSPGLCDSVRWVSSCALKSYWFDL